MIKPWLSVIMPIYNGERYLLSALDSIVNQQDKNIECLIVDDGSKDNSIYIIEKYTKKIPIRFFHKHNKNWVSNTNYALAISKGEYICFLHQDDIWFNNRLATLKKIIKSYPSTGMIIHSSAFISANGYKAGTWKCPLPANQLLKPEFLLERLIVQNFISIPCVTFKKDVLIHAGMMDESLWYTADWDFWLKIANHTDALYYPKPLAGFRIHQNSQTVQKSFDSLDFQKQMDIVLERHISKIRKTNKKLRRIAVFSIMVNVGLANFIHKKEINLIAIIYKFMQMGPAGWYIYLRDSRILERTSARLHLLFHLKVS